MSMPMSMSVSRDVCFQLAPTPLLSPNSCIVNNAGCTMHWHELIRTAEELNQVQLIEGTVVESVREHHFPCQCGFPDISWSPSRLAVAGSMSAESWRHGIGALLPTIDLAVKRLDISIFQFLTSALPLGSLFSPPGCKRAAQMYLQLGWTLV